MLSGWVDAYLVEDGDFIVVESYAGTRNWYGTVVVPEDIHVPVTSTNNPTIDGKTGPDAQALLTELRKR